MNDELQARVRKLERQLKMLYSVVACTVIGALCAADDPKLTELTVNNLRVQKLSVVDEKGKPWIEMGVLQDQCYIDLSPPQQAARVTLRASKDRGILEAYGERNGANVSMGCFGGGLAGFEVSDMGVPKKSIIYRKPAP